LLKGNIMNLNGKTILAICGAILSVLMVSTAQLTDLFGPGITKSIISVAGLTNMILNSITVALSTQGSLVKEVAAMPGVERIQVNTQANQTLAQVATDPQQPKVGTNQEDRAQVIDIATGASP
jgi:hypothetical protein